ncbi:MAG: hypothetical protein ACLTZI_07100 [[Eubacterium] siraeum]
MICSVNHSLRADISAETGFDNSGLIYYALTSNGVDCPRGLTAQKEMGTEIALEKLCKRAI